MTEKIGYCLEDIHHRYLFEESKIKLATSYKEDVSYLIDIIKKYEQKVAEYERINSVDKEKMLEFKDKLTALCHEYSISTSHPVAC